MARRVDGAEGLFTDGDPPALLGSRCAACGAHHFPRHDTCPYCSAEDPQPVELSRTGTLWAWTAVTAAPPGYAGDVPYGVGVVELPEGIRVITRLTVSDPAALSLGQAMELRVVPLHADADGNDVMTFAFAPVGGAHDRRRHHRGGDAPLRPLRRACRPPTWASWPCGPRSARPASAKGGFQAAFCGTAYGGVATGHKVLSRLGMTGMPIVDVEAGCASGGAALMLAAGAIRAGQYDTVLVFGTEKMPKGIIRSSFFEPWQEEAGLAATPAFFALRAQRLAMTSGVTKEHLAQVVVKNRRHGAANPDAMYQKEISAEEVLASRVVCEPLHLFMLCSPNEGAAAVVLTRDDRRAAPAPGSGHPGRSRAALPPARRRAERVHPAVGSDRRHRALPDHAGGHGGLRGGGARARGPRRGRVPGHRRRPRAPVLRGARAVRARRIGRAPRIRGPPASAGRLPVNPSGGLLSKGEPLGASALGQVVELVRQLRGECGARQVEGARVALSHTVGRGANAGVVILTR